MKVMLDTNVLAPGLASPSRGVCAAVLNAVLAAHELAVSTKALEECERVLIKKMRVQETHARAAISFLVRHAEVIRPTEPATWPLRDQDDRWIVAAALEGNVDALITGDSDILDDPQDELDVFNPRQFLELLDER